MAWPVTCRRSLLTWNYFETIPATLEEKETCIAMIGRIQSLFPHHFPSSSSASLCNLAASLSIRPWPLHSNFCGRPSTGFCLRRISKKCEDLIWGSVRSQAMANADGVPPGYRPNVGICLVNDKNQVFVASRLDIPGAWQMPQGGVDDGEKPSEAAIRELREETGVKSIQVIGEAPGWLTYDFPPDVHAKILKLWGKAWTGQAQKWFLFRFVGDESEIDLAGNGKEAPEFSEWKWLPVDEVIKGAVDFKKPVYEEVFKFFLPILNSAQQS